MVEQVSIEAGIPSVDVLIKKYVLNKSDQILFHQRMVIAAARDVDNEDAETASTPESKKVVNDIYSK